MKTKIPRLSYALCLGTYPIEEARRIKSLMSKNETCNVEFKLRGRGANRPKSDRGNYIYKDYLPLKLATHAAIYVTVKRSLKRMEKAAQVRYKMLEAVRKSKPAKSEFGIDPKAFGHAIAQSIIGSVGQ